MAAKINDVTLPYKTLETILGILEVLPDDMSEEERSAVADARQLATDAFRDQQSARYGNGQALLPWDDPASYYQAGLDETDEWRRQQPTELPTRRSA